MLDIDLQIEHKIKKARDYESQGKLLHAVQIYISILNENPDSSDALIGIANNYEILGNIEPAVELLSSYLEGHNEDIDVRLFLGQFLLRNTRWENAIEVLSYILPEEEPIVAFFIGYSHFMLDEFELAKINFNNFVSLGEESELLHEANIYLAKIELKLKNYENALLFAKKADAMYSNFWELNLIYAETYYNLGMYEHAVTKAEKSIQLNPNEPAPYQWAGKIYLKLGQYGKAEKQLLKYVESIDNASSDIYTKLADACLKLKKTKDALAYYDIALKLDPENNFAKEGKKSASSILNNNVVNDA